MTTPWYIARQLVPKTDKEMKHRWVRLDNTQDNVAVYPWHTQLQEDAMRFEVLVISFRGTVLRHEAYVLCMPGMGMKLHETCNRLLTNILRENIPGNDKEEDVLFGGRVRYSRKKTDHEFDGTAK